MPTAYNPRYPYNEQGHSDLSNLFKTLPASDTSAEPTSTPTEPLTAEEEFSIHTLTVQKLTDALKTVQQRYKNKCLDDLDSRSLPDYNSEKSQVRPLSKAEIDAMEVATHRVIAQACQSRMESLWEEIKAEGQGDAPYLFADYYDSVVKLCSIWNESKHEVPADETLAVKEAYAQFQNSVIASCQSALALRKRSLAAYSERNPDLTDLQREMGLISIEETLLASRVASNTELWKDIRQKAAKKRKEKARTGRRQVAKREETQRRSAAEAAERALSWYKGNWCEPLRPRGDTQSLPGSDAETSDGEASEDEDESAPLAKQSSYP